MLSNGYSKSQIEKTLKKLNLPYSREEIEDIKEFIREKLQYYSNRDLETEWFAVYIDAYHCKIRDENSHLKKSSVYTAVGIDFEGYKHVIGFWVSYGHESVGFWSEVLQDLINRGATRIMLFVTDNFKGLKKLIGKLYPLSDHQFCFIHLSRNLRNKLSRKLSKEALKLWRRIKLSDSPEEASSYYDELVELVKHEKTHMAKTLSNTKENYLCFLKCPEEARKYIYTTNIIESINAGIERMRVNSGGFFASFDTLESNLFIQYVNLQDKWFDNPIPKIKACSYELRQLFEVRFNLEEEFELYTQF